MYTAAATAITTTTTTVVTVVTITIVIIIIIYFTGKGGGRPRAIQFINIKLASTDSSLEGYVERKVEENKFF